MMSVKNKYLFLFLLLSAGLSSYSQTITKDDVVSGLTGKWNLVYENELTQPDTISIVDNIIIELKKRKGKEIGQLKDGSRMSSSIKWKFIESDKGIAVIFNGGIWMDEEEFIIKKITPEKIFLLSCGKHDHCDEVYFIK